MTSVRKLPAICAASGFLASFYAEASAELSHDIPAQPLAQALSEFAAQTHLQVVYVSGIAATRFSERTPRGLPAADALGRLLAGTGLYFEFLNDRTVRIFAGPNDGNPPFDEQTLAPQSSSASRAPVDSLEDVTVVGARWWMDPNRAVAPVTVLARRDLERGGESSIGDILQALPMTTGSPLNTSVNAPGSAEPRGRGPAGDGSVRIFLHDLPTVVLLNGRRLPNSGLGGDASVDLNSLPMSAIERIEVMAGGASAAFGADAVGGVVNIVTRRVDHGLELSGTRTITERGDGEIVTGQAVFGFELLGGAWSLGIDYVEEDGVTMDRRSYSARPLLIIDGNGTLAPVGLNNMTPDGYFDIPVDENALGLATGFYTRVPGASGQTSADYQPYERATDGYNPAPFNYSQTPNQRAALWLIGSRPLDASTHLFVEAFAQHRESAQQAAPAFYRTGFAQPTDGGHPADNYYNPFGIDLPVIWRRVVEAGNRRNEQEVDVWRALIGLEGSVAGWTWEVALQSARSEATSVEKGFLSRPHLISALGPSGLDDSGNIVCGSPDPGTGRVPAASIIPGCVPLNLFGGAGSITEEQLAYVIPGSMINRGTNEQRYAEFVLGGPGGRILGRDMQWTLGAEYRREAGRVTPDSLHADYASELLRFSPFPDLFRLTPDVSGHYDVYELFSALQLPLLHGRRWAEDMALNFGLRWSDYGSFDNDTSWQAGFRWQPAQEFTLRANYGEVFRVPSLAELYEQPVAFEQFPFDPCGNEPKPAQQPNCAANGVPGGTYVQDGWGAMAVYGGNPELKPESGHTLAAGVTYTPLWARGLSTSIDYIHVKLSNYIATASPDDALFHCAEHGNMCDLITRLPDGRVIGIAANYQNLGQSEVSAFDFAINWSAMSRVGELSSRLLATYLDRWDRQPLPDGEVHSYAGKFDAGARPRWRASGHLDWRSEPWTASYAAEYIGPYSELVEPWPVFGIEFEPFNRRVDAVLYHDLEAGFTFNAGITARLVVSNVTDEDPPYLNISPANTDVSTYRLLGRSYFLELRYRVE